jgi:2-polyprenyl-6-methoxyphenol hydroxylase-like FAD-dependent oxidoreductase
MQSVIIIGAGPVGLLLANLLGRLKIDTLVLEKDTSPSRDSRAIGIMPPSLSILHTLGLDSAFMQKGVWISNAFVHGSKKLLGLVRFTALPSEYAGVLSLPQYETQALLGANLKKYSGVRLLRGKTFSRLEAGSDRVTVAVRDRASGHMEYYSCAFLCACDGRYSAVRRHLKIPFYGRRYNDTFLMGDFRDATGFGRDAHLFFTTRGAVESFPLPRGQRRWIVQTERLEKDAAKDFIGNAVLKRTGIDISSSPARGQSAFSVEHFRIKSYSHLQRVFFCGDSAHTMSPVGGQGMNTGFADARLLSDLLDNLVNGGGQNGRLISLYHRYRKKAAGHAARRAWLSMRIGTLRGRPLSALRSMLIVLFIKLFKKRIPPYFAMLTIPNRGF